MKKYRKIGKVCYKCCEKVWENINIRWSFVLLERRRKGTVLHKYPLNIFLSSNHPEEVRMRKCGKVAVVHIYFHSIHFFVASLFFLSAYYLIRDETRKGGTEPLYLSEEFVEKFSEVFFRDDGMII
ncbi:MAG: hypothetical protein IMZ52_05190 [Actinobacteria bacterium]|nr:hypothetical protein [Actinomycetota bacterium]